MLWGESGAQEGRGRGEDYPLTSPDFSALSSYRQEREGFLPSHPPAPGRKPVEFLDVSDLTQSAPASPCPTHLFPYCSLFLGLPCLAISCPSSFGSPAAPLPSCFASDGCSALPCSSPLPAAPLRSFSQLFLPSSCFSSFSLASTPFPS